MFKTRLVFVVLIVVLVLLASPVLPSTIAQENSPPAVGLRPDAPPYAVHGPYWVGTRDYLIPEGDSVFGVTVWYPALNPDNQPEEITYHVSKEFLGWLGLPEDTDFPIAGHALAAAAPDVEHGPYPLVVISTGLTMWRQNGVYMFEHLASQGFVVLAMEHRGENWVEFWQSAYYRPVETMLTIQYAGQLTAEGGDLAGVIDVDKVAVMGHSSGGWTALIGGGAQMNLGGCPVNPGNPEGLVWFSDCMEFLPKQEEIAALFGLDAAPAGSWPQAYDPHVDAVVSMNPDGDIFGAQYEGAASLTAPTMVITTSQDSINIPEHGAYPIYERLGSTTKALVVFEGADHPLFTDACAVEPWVVDYFDLFWLCADPVWDKDRAHDLMNQFVTAFLLATLKDDTAAATALSPDAVSFPGIEYQAEASSFKKNRGENVCNTLPPLGAYRPTRTKNALGGYIMNARFSKLLLSVVLIVALALPVLEVTSLAVAQDTGTYWPTNGWQTSTPEEQGMDSQMLAKFLQLMSSGAGFQGALVIRHGYVVLDVSSYPFVQDQPHALYSATKSIVSTLVGIAIDKGFIKGADQSIWDFFSKEDTANMDARKEVIALKHLLTQSSGLGLGVAEDIGMYLLTAEDQPWDQYVLDFPMATDPGAEFNYLDANAHLASAIVTQATGMSAYDFAQQHLFGPLGITEVIWVADPQGISRGGSDSFMSAYNMAKLGYLYLHNGEWDGQQLLSPSWIVQATSGHTQPEGWPGEYGFLWWTWPFNDVSSGELHESYLALGLGGQEIWVIPDLDLVIVLTGDVGYQGPDMISRYLLKAVQANTSLPENPEAVSKLQAQVDAIAHPTPAEIPPLSEATQGISGIMYTLAENSLGWTSIGLEFQGQEALLKLDVGDSHLELPVGLDGVDRISSEGLPAAPWWILDNVPLALTGSWYTSGTFLVSMRDLRGMLDFAITMNVGESLHMTVTPRLSLITQEWQKPAITIEGTPQ